MTMDACTESPSRWSELHLALIDTMCLSMQAGSRAPVLEGRVMTDQQKNKEERAAVSAELDTIIGSQALSENKSSDPIVISSVRMAVKDGLCFVITRSVCGQEGISIAGSNWTFFFPILAKKIAPYFIGTNALDLEKTLELIYVRDLNYKIQGLAYWCCVAWIEASVLDLIGKACQLSISDLLGERCRQDVAYYCASGNRHTTPEEEIDFLIQKTEAIGAQAIKFKIGGRMSHDCDSMDGRSEKLIRQIRNHFDDSYTIMADGNGSFSPDVAIAYGRQLEDIGAAFFEEPCPFDHLWETKHVADVLTIPIAFGEQETSMRRFKWLIESAASQVLQPDIQYNGGFIRTIKVARMAAAAQIPIVPHISEGIQYAYVLLLAAITPNMGDFQEFKDGYFETRHFFTNDLMITNGKINLPTGPGLGMVFTNRDFINAETIFMCDGLL